MARRRGTPIRRGRKVVGFRYTNGETTYDPTVIAELITSGDIDTSSSGGDSGGGGYSGGDSGGGGGGGE